MHLPFFCCKMILKNIDIAKTNLKNIDIDIDIAKKILKNKDINIFFIPILKICDSFIEANHQPLKMLQRGMQTRKLSLWKVLTFLLALCAIFVLQRLIAITSMMIIAETVALEAILKISWLLRKCEMACSYQCLPIIFECCIFIIQSE